METCPRCRIWDWAGFRQGLELTQGQFAELLGMGLRSVQRLEGGPGHRCLGKASLKLLRFWLQDPEIRARLRANRYPHPWPEDLD